MQITTSTEFTTAGTGALAQAPANTLSRLEIVPTGKAVGAEIRGLDLSQPVPADVKQALRDAWAKHLVLVFRGQDLAEEQFIAAAEIFGTLKEAGSRKYLLQGGKKAAHFLSKHPVITVLSNLDENGKPVKENVMLGSLEVEWHSDNSYVEVPPAGSVLYSKEIPPNGSGDTSFNNQYLAYDELPDDLKKAIEGKVQVQDSSRDSSGTLRPGAKLPTKPSEVEGPRQPIVRVHPVTGRRTLYLGRHRVWPSNYIVGMSDEGSQELLKQLWAHATQPKYAWTHVWKVGDLLIWDNRCCLHRREEVDATQRRVMLRTVIEGEAVVGA
jgi:taurine dioxygenase